MMMTPYQTKLALMLTALAIVAGLAGCQDDQKKVALPADSAQAAAPSEDGANAANSAAKTPAAASDTAANTGSAKLQSANHGRRFSGSFEPQRTTAIATSVPGIIRDVYVVEGQKVDKGDKLINIDSQNYSLQVAQAEAGVKAAKAQVDTLQVEFDRATTLRKQEAVAASQVDQLTGQLAGARAQLQQAQVAVRLARKARSDAMIRAPYDGVITMVNAAEGDFAAPSPQPLLQLAEVQKLYLRVHIPEQFSAQVDAGDTLEVRIPALNKTMKLPVTRVNPMISAQSRAFDVLAEVDNSDLKIRAGMFAEVTLANQQGVARSEAPDADAESAQHDATQADEGKK